MYTNYINVGNSGGFVPKEKNMNIYKKYARYYWECVLIFNTHSGPVLNFTTGFFKSLESCDLIVKYSWTLS